MRSPEVTATGHERTIITIQEHYLGGCPSPSQLSKEQIGLSVEPFGPSLDLLNPNASRYRRRNSTCNLQRCLLSPFGISSTIRSTMIFA